MHVVAASNGNGALAAACASKALFLECTVFVTEGVSQGVVELLKREEAKVIVEGKLYSKALKKAKAAVAANPKAYASRVSTSKVQAKSDLHKRTQDPRSNLR